MHIRRGNFNLALNSGSNFFSAKAIFFSISKTVATLIIMFGIMVYATYISIGEAKILGENSF
jgi:hypothetical protein